jgi:predicted MFS family arabinose efflux permease
MIYTYIAQILERTAHVGGATLALALLMWGIGGTVGAFGSGWLTDRRGATRTLSWAIAALTVTLVALAHAASVPLVCAVMVVNGAAGWAMATPNNHRLTALAPHVPSVVISYNSSGIYLGQAVGAALGGILLSHQASATALCLTGAALAGAALVLNLAIAQTARGR